MSEVTMTPIASVEAGAAEYAALSTDSRIRTDHALALIAHRAPGSDGLFASLASEAAARIGEADGEKAFEPSDAVMTWDAHISNVAGAKPYLVAESTIRNYRNAMRIIFAAGLDHTDARTFADAKSLAPKYTSEAKAKAIGGTFAETGDARNALSAAKAGASVRGGAASAKAKSAAADRAKERGTGIAAVAFDLRALFEKVEAHSVSAKDPRALVDFGAMCAALVGESERAADRVASAKVEEDAANTEVPALTK